MRVHASATGTSKKDVLAKIKPQLKTAQNHLQEMEAIEPGDKQRHKPADGVCANPHADWIYEQIAKQVETLPDVKDRLYRVLANVDLPPGDLAEYSSVAVTCDIIKPN
jgi:hypothetical protein